MIIDEKTIKITRKSFESSSIDDNLLINLYSRYNKDAGDASLFIKRAKKLFPKLNCGLSSLYLQKVLGGGKIINGKYKGQNHTFLLSNNTIIDITADQYGGPRIYVGPLKKPWIL
jgi:hypothetical protein